MEYTVNSGDCMWNIVKSQYGDKVKTNADILKAVNKLAEINNIEDPNLIHTGSTLNIPSYESIFENASVDKKAEGELEPKNENEAKAVSTSIYEDFSNWIKESYQKLAGGKKEEVEMYDYVDSDISPDDEEFNEPLTEGANKLATSNLEISDKDKDGSMGYEEYLAQETNQYNELFPDDSRKIDDKTGKIMSKNSSGDYEIDDYTNDFMQENFSALDKDKNGSLDKDELSAYYMAMDASDSTKGLMDGKIQVGAMMNTDLTSDDFQKRLDSANELLNTDDEE